MKRKWHALIDGLTFPLVLMFCGEILIGIGNTFTSPTVQAYLTLTGTTFGVIMLSCKYIGSLLVSLFPLLVLLNLLGKRYNDSIPIIGGFVGYLLLSITTMLLASSTLDSYCYTDFLGLQIDLSSVSVTSGVCKPLNIGLLATAVVLLIIRSSYKWSRSRLNYGMMTFVNNDTWFFLVASLLTVIAGVGISFGYPYFINIIKQIFNFIASDLNNPICLFVYGLMERVMSVCGIGNIIHTVFWQTSLGGTWTNTLGVIFNGDVAVWTAQFAAGTIEKSVGRMTTPFFILNLFIVPSILAGLYSRYTNRLDRSRVTGLIVLGVITSLFSSSLLPLELLLLIIAPEFFFFHVIASSSLYGILGVLGVNIGYSYSGILNYATPGTVLSLWEYVSKMGFNSNMITLLIVGVAAFIVYQLAMKIYYDYLAQDFLDRYGRLRRRKAVIKGLGGIANIRLVDSTPIKLTAVVYDPTLVDFEKLKQTGAYLIKENRFGYDVDIGPGAVMLWRDIRIELKYYLKLPVKKTARV